MKLFKFLFSRIGMLALAALLEAGLLGASFVWLADRINLAWLEILLRLISLIVVLHMVRTSRHLSHDLMWIILIVLFPVAGTAIYLFIGANLFSSRTFRSLIHETEDARRYLIQDPEVLSRALSSAPKEGGQFTYLSLTEHFPVYDNRGFDYYALGEDGWPVMLEELQKAEKFIFIEYFIIERGEFWNSILSVLKEKARDGVDVRVMYDDMGSIHTLPSSYQKQLEADGIRCVTFNRLNPFLNIIMNHRDHRKIMVIDGQVAFSGGINLADEYVNRIRRFGLWKDNVIRVQGPAVWTYTVLFLTNWNALRPTDSDYLRFKADARDETLPSDGFIVPYGETPLDTEITAQNVYAIMLNQANDYCYISTPYLIIDTDLINTLILTAKRGVDVRLLTPGIPDKKLIWRITRSYYRELINGGVKIYEYTPGFNHAKVFVRDDIAAAVGTINLDYRSLYLHFENGTYLYGSDRVQDVRRDMLSAIAESRLIRAEDCRERPLQALINAILRIFSPLL